MTLHFFSPARPPADEAARQAAVDASGLAGAPPDPALEAIVAEAVRLFEVPIGAVSIIDRDRQWFAAGIGLAARQTSRAISFCGHGIHTPDALLVVNDACADARFAGNPLVTDAPYLRFYAGAPILARGGQPLGALCVIDRKPRDGALPLEELRRLARRASDRIAEC